MDKRLNDLIRQAQQIQKKMLAVQEELSSKTIEASAGGGMVKVTVNGKQEIVDICIDPSVVSADDIEMLQDLVVAAVNEGIRRSREMMMEEMKKITGGLSIPGFFT